MTDTRSYAFKAEELLLECSDTFHKYAIAHALKAAAYKAIGKHKDALESQKKANTNERMVHRINAFLETYELPTVQ